MIKAHELDAGYDLVAQQEAWIQPGEVTVVATGDFGNVPAGMVGFVCPRSGLALKQGITVVNAPGVVDAGYTGEIKVLLTKFGGNPYRVEAGERIAQIVYVPLGAFNPGAQVERGDGGFGSSGTL